MPLGHHEKVKDEQFSRSSIFSHHYRAIESNELFNSTIGCSPANVESEQRTRPSFSRWNEFEIMRLRIHGNSSSERAKTSRRRCLRGDSKYASTRGQAWLYFFDDHLKIIGKYYPISAEPKWCEGSRIYFFGLESNGEEEGNAWISAKDMTNPA